MKILYTESKLRNLKVSLSNGEIKKLPKKLFLAYSIQYKALAYDIKELLEKNNIIITKIKQVLGCSKIRLSDDESILFIGSGRFHSMNLFLQAKNIFILDNNRIINIQESEINALRSKRKTALLKFLSAENIGIFVSTKPGQSNLKKALLLKHRLNKKEKSCYIFVSNKIDISQFENFNIDSWINTACIGLSYDNPDIINLDEIPDI
ncbi:MAG: diphthamide synthesis protein [Nanoarchaeota archaeon]|nr:diphthamide synthesis protein [Nanoarchaeota archaeon]